MPLVSVVVPTHNRPDMLAEALASVRAQTFVDYEIIVVSNGESSEVRRKSRAVALLSNARYFALDRGSLANARNFGIEQANGEWIAFLDDDDVWLPEKLERQLAEGERAGADMVACDYVEFDNEGLKPERVLHPGLHGRPTVEDIYRLRWWAAPSAVIVRTAVLRQLRFDTSFAYCEDNDLWRRILWRHRIHQMDGAVLLRKRQSHPSLTRDRIRMVWFEIMFMRKARRDTPPDLRWALPSVGQFELPRLGEIVIPKLLRQPFRRDRLLRRWRAVRSLMGL